MQVKTQKGRRWLLILAMSAAALTDAPAVQAYIGPGAGFAFASSFFVILVTFLLAMLKLVTWPFNWLVRSI